MTSSKPVAGRAWHTLDLPAGQAGVAWLVLGLAATALWWFGPYLAPAQQGAFWGLLLVGLAWLLRQVWGRLFGPVLFYDLVRLARHSRYFLLRCLYGLALLLILYVVYYQFLDHLQMQWQMRGYYYPGQRNPRADELARLAEWFFYTFMGVQLAVVLVLTPAYTAGAISEEKDRKTLEFLLATDLHSREIVLSKVVSRLANMALIILTGLPVLSFTQLLGGVDPNLVLAGFAATGLTLASLGAFSILCSVYARKSRDAILLTYLGMATYLSVATLLASTPDLAGPLTDALNAGNLVAVLSQLSTDVRRGVDLTTSIPPLLWGYALFHGTLALVCVLWAVARMRVVALRQAPGGTPRPVAGPGRAGRRRIGYLPMVWKEIHNEPGFRLNGLGWLVIGLCVLLSLAPGLWTAGTYLLGKASDTWMPLYSRPATLGDTLGPWVQIAGSAVASLLLVGVAMRAAGSVSGERDRETLDALLTAPLESHDILFAKWLGSLLSVRWGWVWLGVIWGIGLATGAIYPAAILLLLVAWTVYAGTLAGVGLWFSTACPTTLRATLQTLLVTGVICTAPWLLYLFCLPLGGFVGRELGELVGILSPPMVLAMLARSQAYFHAHELWTLASMFGLFAWSVAAVLLWSVTRSRFRKLTSRMPQRRRDPLPPATRELRMRLGDTAL